MLPLSIQSLHLVVFPFNAIFVAKSFVTELASRQRIPSIEMTFFHYYYYTLILIVINAHYYLHPYFNINAPDNKRFILQHNTQETTKEIKILSTSDDK